MAIQHDIVIEELRKFPNIPSLTLAKKVYRENPECFTNVEGARTVIRFCRGKSGDKQRRTNPDKTFFDFEGSYNPFDSLPEGFKYFEEWTPVQIDCKRALVVGDTHIPYHDKAALSIALQYGKDHEIDTIVILGDFADFYSISNWEKDPRQRDFHRERQIAIDVLTVIRDIFVDAQIIYLVGNHEERYERLLKVKAPDLYGIEMFEFANFIEAEKNGVTVVGDRRILKIAKLNLVHGHEFGRSISSPVNPARGLYLRGKEHCIAGHWHQPSHHSENSMNDAFTGCWSIGCLCDMHPNYLPINKWSHGFAMVEKRSKKEFEVFNKKILDGRVYSG